MATLSGTAAYRLGEATSPALEAATAAKIPTASCMQTEHLPAGDSFGTPKSMEDKTALELGSSLETSPPEPKAKIEPVSATPRQDEAPKSNFAEEPQTTSIREQHIDASSQPSQTANLSEAEAIEARKSDTETQTFTPSTPERVKGQPLAKEPPTTPRIKKKISWKGKNIMISMPRDDHRGKPGEASGPLLPHETERMFASWVDLGYNIDGFDLITDEIQPVCAEYAQSRDCWPSAEDLINERDAGYFQINLPDLNAWKDYVQGLQEAKLRALGVSDATEEQITPSISPSFTVPSRQSSAQYPPLPFSPPIPTSSASSNLGFNLQTQLRFTTANKTEGDENYEIETNPSNLGTPVQNFDFPAVLSHQPTTLNTASNPWNTFVRNGQASDHERKASTSKLNVKAPEFKFNPTSSFTSGLFNFSPASFQPMPSSFQAAAFQAHVDHCDEPSSSVPQFGDNSFGLVANSASFTPGQSEFSFSTSGPKFRPDAPSFTPFQTLANSHSSVDKNHQGRTDSIFGSINIDASEVSRPVRKSKAIPIIRPSSKSSARSLLIDASEDSDDPGLDNDGRLTQDESRIKRARSLAPEGQEVASFAQMPLSSIIEQSDNAPHIEHNMPAAQSRGSTETKQPSISSEFSPAAQNETLQPLRAAKDAAFDNHQVQDSTELNNKRKAHKENSLSAAAISSSPVVASYGKKSPPPLAKPKGLAASRFAKADHTTHQPEDITARNVSASIRPSIETQEEIVDLEEKSAKAGEPTFEEIDAVMQQMENDPSMGVKKSLEQSSWNQPTTVESQQHLYKLRAVAHEFVPQFNQAVPAYPTHSEKLNASVTSIELEDPFIDPPSQDAKTSNEHDAEPGTEPASDWEAIFTEDEYSKLESRTQFFDGRVNEVVGNLLTSRLEPMERTLLAIQNALDSKGRRAPSSRHDIRSTTGENPESDADDEDDEAILNRSLSPRRDRRLDQIRAMITEVLVSQQADPSLTTSNENTSILAALEDIKSHMGEIKHSARIGRGAEDRISGDGRPSISKSDDAILAKLDKLQTLNIDLEQRLQSEQSKVEREVEERRAAEDASAELNRKLHAAETRVEVEIINKSVYDQRVGDLEERLRLQEEKTEEERKQRRLLEDKLCDAQRQLKHASEEETRLTETLEERDSRIKDIEQASSKKAMRMTLLEVASSNASQAQSEMTNKLNALEGDLREVRQDNNHWRAEAERADEAARRSAGELSVVRDENQTLRSTLQTVTIQLQENERLRESWRGKFTSLQESMANAAREVSEESAKRIKKDQAMFARQEVLNARLQAEAKTRERLEIEMERLQLNERSGMRAVNECTRLEGILGELRTEKDKLQQTASRYQREFEEARESGASEVKRTRMSLQTEIDAANHQVNVVRQELEEQITKLRGEIDNIRLEADLAKERSEMLLEEAQASKTKALLELERKHQNEIEDMQVRYERQINNAAEDNQRSEEALLERLSLSSSKIEHLNDRVLHLESKLEISKQAAAAAAQAAKAASVESTDPAAHVSNRYVSTELPEKISPQALRESIMVLQEQLHAREQRIEELEQQISELDPEAPFKISKRDEEISWLRELLAVRHGDLQDIISALSGDSFDHEAVKDATIRLEANLQMEEQERERAMNGGSAITLPNIAQSIQAATPRVAKTIGSGFNALDRWRKSGQSSFFSGVINSPLIDPAATPSRSKPSSVQQSKLLSGLMTPPASGFRQTSMADSNGQPTAFANTGRRFPPQGSIYGSDDII